VKTLTGKTTAALMVTAMLAGCGGGGTSDSLSTEGEVATAIEDSAAGAAAVVDESVTEAGNALQESAETVAAAAEGMAGESWNALQDNWQDSIGDIKDRWAELSEEDLLLVNGDRDQLVSLVQDKYGLDRKTAETEVDDWASTL